MGPDSKQSATFLAKTKEGRHKSKYGDWKLIPTPPCRAPLPLLLGSGSPSPLTPLASHHHQHGSPERRAKQTAKQFVCHPITLRDVFSGKTVVSLFFRALADTHSCFPHLSPVLFPRHESLGQMYAPPGVEPTAPAPPRSLWTYETHPVCKSFQVRGSAGLT